MEGGREVKRGGCWRGEGKGWRRERGVQDRRWRSGRERSGRRGGGKERGRGEEVEEWKRSRKGEREGGGG